MPQELKDVLTLSLLNPATILIGYWLGRIADQRQKVVVGAMAAGIGGAVFAWILMRFGFVAAKPRLIAGVFLTSALLGIAWFLLGHTLRRYKR